MLKIVSWLLVALVQVNLIASASIPQDTIDVYLTRLGFLKKGPPKTLTQPDTPNVHHHPLEEEKEKILGSARGHQRKSGGVKRLSKQSHSDGQGGEKTLKFRLSAKNLPNKDKMGHSDPFIVVSYADKDHLEKVKLGQTAIILNSGNPMWGETFSFNFDRQKNQRWHFAIYDRDLHGKDDLIGTNWVKVKYYLDHGEFLKIPLEIEGEGGGSKNSEMPILTIKRDQ